MIRFSDRPSLSFINQRRAVLKRPLAVSIGPNLLLTIPAGFETDGLSRQWWMPAKWGRWKAKYLRAAILHDFLLADPERPRWQADWLFMGALRADGVSALEAGLFWLAVRSRRPAR